MTYFLHRYTGALSKCLLALIGLILLATTFITTTPTATTPDIAATSAPTTTSLTATTTSLTATTTNAPTATRLSRQPARDQENTPNPHCHPKIYLSLDKRYDLKPLFFIPLPSFRLAALSVEHLTTAYSFSASLAAGAVRPACLRGPPSI